MKTERIKITPALAREWLQLVPEHQRRLDKKPVEKIATAIRAGQWRENGATFVFDADHCFIDGQHRAQAIVAAERPVWALVVRNVDKSPETFETIDDSKARAIQDFLTVPSANTVAAVARIYWLVDKNYWSKREPKVPIADCLKLTKPRISEISESIRKTHAAGHVVGEGSFMAFLYFYYVYILKHNESETVTAFFERLVDGANLPARSPTNLLRNRCLGVSKMGVNFKLSRTAKRALIIKALNAELQKQSFKKLSWDPGREPFPEFLK